MKRFLFLLLSLMLLSGCRKANRTDDAARGAAKPLLNVTASLRPYALLAQEIGGERIAVDTLLKTNSSPHLYSPKMSELRQLEKTDLFILNGMRLEGSLETVLPSLKNSLTVADLYSLTEEEYEVYESDSVCAHGKINPHFWYSPEVMKKTAATLAEMLSLLDEEGAELYRSNAVRFAEETDRVTATIQAERQNYPAVFSYLVMHDSYAYLNELLNLKAAAVEATPGREISAKAAAALLDTIEADGIRFLVLEPQTEGRSARRIAESVDLGTVVIDPLGADFDSFFDYFRKTWELLAHAYDSN